MALPRRKDKYRTESRTISYDHAQVVTDTTVKLWTVPAGRSFRVDRVFYNNPTGLAANASNYYDLKVLNAAATAANRSTAATALTANTPVEFTLAATDADRVLAAGAELALFLDLTGTATLPAGRVVIEGTLI